MWIDTHCHLPFEGELPPELQRARDAGVDGLVVVGTDLATSRNAVNLAIAAGGDLRVALGLHPHDARHGLASLRPFIDETLVSHPEILVGIGECGLDYHYEHSPRADQREAFAEQVRWAHEMQRTLVIHTREAWDETFAILRSETIPPRTVIHCFTGGVREAEKALELGLHLSFSGIVTFPKATEVQAAARICPLDRLTIETDSPYLAPVPKRGSVNEPANIGLVGRYMADLRKEPIGGFASAVSITSRRLFDL